MESDHLETVNINIYLTIFMGIILIYYRPISFLRYHLYCSKTNINFSHYVLSVDIDALINTNLFGLPSKKQIRAF